MAAMITFNPLALAARAPAASHVGASARRVASPKMATRVSNARKVSFARAAKESDDDMDFMGEIGLGEEMEDMLKKADGGRSVPKFIADLGVEPLTEAFKFLGSDSMTGPGSELLFVEKYGSTLYREAGFTATAELINGRLAQIGFVLAVQNTFNGDILTMIAKYPLDVLLLVAAISGASLVQVANPKGYFPSGLMESVMKGYEGAGGPDIFSEKAETINGRAAMVGIAVFVLTATIFEPRAAAAVAGSSSLRNAAMSASCSPSASPGSGTCRGAVIAARRRASSLTLISARPSMSRRRQVHS
eukprot:CAMPEP_0181363308 /NCGR_PEP_ID=MMETSP1106-20121128/8630_1 /TAXON_ID=81844 /ORGANISM="Mantoniella antarctica, Strain SL-175" /LENGTH=302 /DNA_ID=CAMNT_0023477639 /DNA_START=48 /DNA_END=957 /DNA_ORIENTATION=-